MQLKELIMAPYIQKAMALRNKRRKVGGNIYRHSMAVMRILLLRLKLLTGSAT
ncbi:MAG: hypothetical protein WCO63_12320 [Bacteroidota bacterium]